MCWARFNTRLTRRSLAEALWGTALRGAQQCASAPPALRGREAGGGRGEPAGADTAERARHGPGPARFVLSWPGPSCPGPSRPVHSRPVPSSPIPSPSVPSRLVLSPPVPSRPVCPIPSPPVPSRLVPSRPVGATPGAAAGQGEQSRPRGESRRRAAASRRALAPGGVCRGNSALSACGGTGEKLPETPVKSLRSI